MGARHDGADEQAWLERQVRAASARAGLLVRGKSDKGPWEVTALWPAGAPPRDALLATARVALATMRPVVQDGAAARNDAEGLERIAIPFRGNDASVGVVALAAPGGDPAQRAARLEILQRGVRGLDEDAGATDPGEILASIEPLLAETDLRAGAMAVVTSLATRLGLARAALGRLERGRAVQLFALSHSARFDPRSALAADLEAAMAEALDQGRSLAFPGRGGAAVLRDHERLARAQGAGAVATVLLLRGEEAVGALTVESHPDEALPPTTLGRLEALAKVLGPLVALAQRAERPLRLRLRDALARELARLRDPSQPQARVALALVVGLAVLLTLVPFPHRVSAPARLEGRVQRAVVAPIDGFVAEARARAGDAVRQGELLATLDDGDLRVELRKWQARRNQLASQHRAALATHDRAEASILATQRAQAEAEIALLEAQAARTSLVAPFDGVVARGDLSRALGSPVERGEVLFEVAPVGDHRVVLEVDERDIARVRAGQEGRLTLSALPDRNLSFAVSRVTHVSHVDGTRNFFRVEALLDAPRDELRPGMEGVARLEVGRRSLLWIWTHRLIDGLRLLAWSWLP
jgi:RND family efflux transporter MFP subunit